jgi:hypothetical protein
MSYPLELPELIEYICFYLDIKDVLTFELVCKLKCNIIRKLGLKHLQIYAKTRNVLDSILKHHNFRNMKLGNFASDEDIYKLKDMYALDLSCTKVTDKSVSKLGNVHTLDLSNTDVTDESVRKLGKVHTLNLYNTKVTDKSVSKLGNVHTLNLYNTKVTDKSVRKLGKVHTLDLGGTKVTKNCIDILKEINPSRIIYSF